MKKFVLAGLLLLLLGGILSGCKSEAETLEENLTSQKWAMVLADGSSATMTFYENNTAIANFSIVDGTYEWYVEENQIHMSYTLSSSSITNAMIFDVEEDNSNGYILTLVDGDYTSSAKEIYNTVKLTPEKES